MTHNTSHPTYSYNRTIGPESEFQMQAILFSIRDSKAGSYGPPFAKYSRGEAEREFVTIARDPQSTINKFPTDFDLFEIGMLDQKSGKVDGLATPVHMMKAIDIIETKN